MLVHGMNMFCDSTNMVKKWDQTSCLHSATRLYTSPRNQRRTCGKTTASSRIGSSCGAGLSQRRLSFELKTLWTSTSILLFPGERYYRGSLKSNWQSSL